MATETRTSYVAPAYADLLAVAREHAAAYANAEPFPNIAFEGFFEEAVLDDVLDEFPDLERDSIRFDDERSVKLATEGEGRFGERTLDFLHFLNSEPFLEFLQELTGIERKLIPDPYFEGAGCHEIRRDGFLKVHADFVEHEETKLDRRLNVLVYLNRDWEEEWGGHFELWDREMKGAVAKVPPNFNTMAIFSTTATSYHGHPDPLRCPPDRARRSLALYYYTNGRPEQELVAGMDPHETHWQGRSDAELRKLRRFQPDSGAYKARRFVLELTPPILVRAKNRIAQWARERRRRKAAG